MGKLIYKISLFFYRIIVHIAALFNQKAHLFIAGRKSLITNIKEQHKDRTASIAWFHCSSLGEFEQGRPLLEEFKTHYPHYEIMLTFFSPSGYEIRKNYHEANYIYYLPVDSKSHARKFIKATRPSIVFFVKYEFWHYYIQKLKDKNIPVISVSSIFRPNQIYFKKIGGFYRKILRNISYFFVQDKRSLELIQSIGLNNGVISGDTRFDRVMAICNNQQDLPKILSFKDGQSLMVVGSCWPEDFEVLISFINDTSIKFIIAPHEIDEKFLSRIENDVVKKTIRYSQIDSDTDLSAFDILLIDNIGMLSSLYKYGEYAFVGGAYGQGLHNILEPATFGLPIFFGNQNYHKFREALDLINLGGAVAVANYDELRIQFRQFTEKNTYNIARQINTAYVKDNTGATTKIIKYCKTLIN